MKENKHLLGIVIIARNEGERLVKCLASVPSNISALVYVDSGSTDSSVEHARNAGATVIQLDMSIPFTAARARNIGFSAIISQFTVDFVQFVDGDCELDPYWIDTAKAFLNVNPNVAVVCGRRREKFPEGSVYNRLCDLEWDSPIGQAKACGGDAMMRADVFEEVGGFRETMIAGEEPELCVRIRLAGWEIWRLDAEMTMHDAAMTRFGQWWKRARRSGHAFAEGAALHGANLERYNVLEIRRILKWALIIPCASLVSAGVFTPWALIIFGAYPFQIGRLALRYGISKKASWERSFFLTLGNIPEALGILEYYWRRLRGRGFQIIEYK